MDTLLRHLAFASDAEWLALAGVVLALIAALAFLADWLALRRRDIDRVSLMPWTTIAMLCLIAAAGLLSLAIPALLGSQAG